MLCNSFLLFRMYTHVYSHFPVHLWNTAGLNHDDQFLSVLLEKKQYIGKIPKSYLDPTHLSCISLNLRVSFDFRSK